MAMSEKRAGVLELFGSERQEEGKRDDYKR